MNNLSAILQNKRIVVLASFALILIIAGIAFSVASSQRSNTTNNTTQQPMENNNQPPLQSNSENNAHINTQQPQPTRNIANTTTPAQSINEFAIKDWILSDNDVYTFQYPTDWKLQRTLFTDGQTVSIVPTSQTPNPYTPTWSITITKTNPNNPVTTKETFYTVIGFQKSTTTLSGQTVQAVSGTFPSGKAVNPIQQTNIYLAKDNYSYVVSYKYPGKTRDTKYEQLFQKITNTVSIEY